jgi:hypothetical protein
VIPPGRVRAVACDGGHRFSKAVVPWIVLRAGLGVEGDAHAGVTVRHRSRVARDPTQPNLRPLHLIQAELFDELAQRGFAIAPGEMGENVTTAGLDLLALPRGTLLRLGADALVEVTGLRNPCAQLDAFRPGLMRVVLGHDASGALLRKAGIMAVVRARGAVRAGDVVEVALPAAPRLALAPV